MGMAVSWKSWSLRLVPDYCLQEPPHGHGRLLEVPVATLPNLQLGYCLLRCLRIMVASRAIPAGSLLPPPPLQEFVDP